MMKLASRSFFSSYALTAVELRFRIYSEKLAGGVGRWLKGGAGPGRRGGEMKEGRRREEEDEWREGGGGGKKNKL